MKTAFQGKSKLLVSAVAALFATVAYTAFAADSDVKTGGNTNKTQGRAIDDVKTGNMTNKTQGRAIDGNVQTNPKKSAKQAPRAIDGNVQTNPAKAAKQAPKCQTLFAATRPWRHAAQRLPKTFQPSCRTAD